MTRAHVSLWLLAVLLGASGCSWNYADLADNPGDENCPPRSVAVAWDEPHLWGKSAADIFEPIAGTCTAPLRWDASALQAFQVEPIPGDTTIEVQVDVDRRSARFIDACPDGFAADAEVHLRTADGLLDITRRLTVHHDDRERIAINLDTPIADPHGSLSVQSESPATLHIELDGAAPCAGEVRLGSRTVLASGALHLEDEVLGTWSATGCPFKQAPVDLDSPYGELGVSLRQAVQDLAGDVAYDGQWDDGQPARLTLRAMAPSGTACAPTPLEWTVLFPVQLTYGTDDGRIELHTTEARFRANSFDDALSLSFAEDLLCTSPDQVLPYTLSDCSALESVTISLGLHRRHGQTSFFEDSLHAVEHERPRDPGVYQPTRSHQLHSLRPAF